MSKLLSRCPVCGAKILVSELKHWSKNSYITRNGTLSRSYRVYKGEDVVATYFSCDKCDFRTDGEGTVEWPLSMKGSYIYSDEVGYHLEERKC